MVSSVCKPRLLMLCDVPQHLPIYQELTRDFDCEYAEIKNRNHLIDLLETVYYDIQGIYAGWDGFQNIGTFDKELIEKCPSSLKIIAIASVGYDNIDYISLKQLKNITLTNVPSIDISNEDVADLALYHTLSTFRHFQSFEKKLRQINNTNESRNSLHVKEFNYESGKIGSEKLSGFPLGHINGGKVVNSPRGKNAAIIGFGAIGKAVGNRLNSIGMNIHYTKRTPLLKSELPSYNTTHHKSLESILPIADVVILCVPGTPANKKMINDSTINLLPNRGSRIVNVGRGSLIDEESLIKGLQSGKVISVGLDVYENEPKVHEGLVNRDDVYLTPHIGSSTIEVFHNSSAVALTQIKDYLINNKIPENSVN